MFVHYYQFVGQTSVRFAKNERIFVYCPDFVNY